MELKSYISMEMNNLGTLTRRVLNGLTYPEMCWRPASGCNSPGLILFHAIRYEDIFVQARAQGKPEIWESERWFEKLGMPLGDVGAHYTVEQVNSFVVPDIKLLDDYAAAVRQGTLDYLGKITPADFDRVITLPRIGEVNLAWIFGFVVRHTTGHIGEIAYLRGLQRGMDK